MTDFGKMFEALTGYEPLRWQCRLYEEWLAGEILPVIDLPTSMGKTNVMAIWLIARTKQMAENRAEHLPTRLVYVVDRRTVVDQATDIAMDIAFLLAPLDAKRFEETAKRKPQLVERKQKFANVLIEICHRLGLAESLAVSTLRGQFADNRDWVRDPSKPAIIIGTVDMIGSRLLFSGYRSSYKQRPLDSGLLGQDSLLILDEAHLSEPFAKLVRDIGRDGPFQHGRGKPMRVVRMSATVSNDREPAFQLTPADLEGDKESNVIVKRYHAEKHLHLHEAVADVNAEIVKMVAELAKDNSRVVIFVRSPDDATKIADTIKKIRGKENKPVERVVEILTGTMRGLERDELLDKPVMKRFLNPQNEAAESPAILVSTSAGEVGFDLNADHLVCDAAPLDSIIQRLGRVNRRGGGVAMVHLFAGKPKEGKKKSTAKKEQESAPAHTYDTASTKTLEIIKQLPKLLDDSLDASPKAFAGLAKPDDALVPKPKIVEVTDILLDAWSMTTIVEPMPGRPPVADWLRGTSDDDDPPQTTIAWRAELDVPGFGDLDIDDIEEWFDAHRILPHETLTVPSYKASEWMLRRWKSVDKKAPPDIAARPCVIDQGGLRKITVETLIERLMKKPRPDTQDILNADIILPASFGGIQRGSGLLDSAAPKPDSGNEIPAKAPDVADEQLPGAKRRYRLFKEGELELALCGDNPNNPDDLPSFVLDLPSNDDSVRQLISMVPKRDRPESGSQAQGLTDHVAAVEKQANEIAGRLALEAPIAAALHLAAKYHDQGKKREIWQNAVGGSMENPLAKSGGRMRPIAGNYRHEFGSLREFIEGHGENRDPEIFDLAAHLIATHHGRARPHFPKGGFDPYARAKSPEIATEAMRRFARLQRKYGHWRLAWLENLLRCADALASAENDGGKTSE